MEKVEWNSIDKKENGLKYSKNYKSSTLPRFAFYYNLINYRKTSADNYYIYSTQRRRRKNIYFQQKSLITLITISFEQAHEKWKNNPVWHTKISAGILYALHNWRKWIENKYL